MEERPMDYNEVENINKELIVKIKDKIHLKDLLPYLEHWRISVGQIQGIEREISNYGESNAVMKFMDTVKRRPGTFPKLVAALKHTNQEEIYKIFQEKIRKYYRNKQIRLAEVLSMISEEERKLDITEEHDVDGSSHVSSSGNVASSQSVLAGQPGGQSSGHLPSSDQSTQDRYRRESQPQSRDPPKVPNTTDNLPAVQTPIRSNTRVSSSSSLSSADNNLQETTGNSQNISLPPDSSKLDSIYAGAPIASLKVKVYNMLGKELEKKSPHDDEPWWNYIINEGDINVSRNDQIQIEDKTRQGKAFLDIMNKRGYTLQDLERLFIQFQITDAINILHRHQNKVIDDRQSNQANENSERNLNQGNENNLNINQAAKADANKDMNISIPQTDAPEDPKGQNTSSVQLLQKQSSTQPESSRISGNVTELNRSPSNISVSRLNSNASNQSFESNADSNLSSMQSGDIEDESVKGTQPVQAHGDPAGTQSQPNPEDDAAKLRNDRIHQFDLDPGAIEHTSYIPVNRPGEQPEEDVNVANMPTNQEGQRRNIEPPGQADSNANLPSEPDGQAGSCSTSRFPLLSIFGSMELSTGSGEPGGGENNVTQGVIDIPPRSYISDDGSSSVDLQNRHGVNYVPPSIESQDSREVTEDSSEYQSTASRSNESSGSLNQPNLIHGIQAGDNTASNLTEDSEK